MRIFRTEKLTIEVPAALKNENPVFFTFPSGAHHAVFLTKAELLELGTQLINLSYCCPNIGHEEKR